MIEMTFELAEKIAKAAHEKSKEFNRPMSISIVDESGRMVYFSRADGAGFYTFDTSKAKAMTAASFKRHFDHDLSRGAHKVCISMDVLVENCSCIFDTSAIHGGRM